MVTRDGRSSRTNSLTSGSPVIRPQSRIDSAESAVNTSQLRKAYPISNEASIRD